MSIRSANLVLDEPQAAYYSGQVLTGRLELVLDEPLEYAAINVTFLGAAQVAWTEYEGSNNTDGLVRYQGREVYFDVVQCLSGGQGLNRLNLGTHNFPFKFQIPPHSPSSFIASSTFKGSAKVAYSIKANVIYGPDKPPGRDESQVEKSFQVIAPFDLNKGSEDIKKPIILELEETCCFSYDPVSVTIHVPHAGFCPGQDIPITITCTNNSTVEIKRMLFQLVQKERYRSTEPVSDMVVPERVLASVKSGPVLTKMKQEVTRYLKVPDMIAPNLMNCSIIDVGFFLKVKIQLSGCNDPMEDTAELCLGHIPLASSQESDKYRHPLQSRFPQAPIPEITNVPMPRETAQVNVPVQSRPYTPSVGAHPHFNIGYPGSTPYLGSNLPIPGSDAPYARSNSPNPVSKSPYPRTNSPIPGTNANAPYQGSNAPYARSNSPNPVSKSPYPRTNSPIPGTDTKAPYQDSNSPYARSNSPNPVSNSPYPRTNSPIPGTNANAPYQGSNAPYASSNSPNPVSHLPYPRTNSPIPGTNANAPYQGSNAPYASSNSPNPVSHLPYPRTNSPIPGTNANAPYQGSNAPYASSNSPNPVSHLPYPRTNSPIPGTNANAPYQDSNAPYARSNSPNPVSNPPYPGSTSPYAVSNLPYARSNSPNPVSNPPYPGSNPPYPVSNLGPTTTPYPANLPYPVSAVPAVSPTGPMPYPGSNPYSANPLRTGTIGFMTPQPNVPYGAGNRAHSPMPPYPKESAPSAPSE